jgi:GT2 family glycosyltransferase
VLLVEEVFFIKPYLSVVIVTKNRHDELRSISLPSLLVQTSKNFEVIVWDASENRLSREVTEDLTEEFCSFGVDLKYFKAPRVGSASQRNDSVKETQGEVLFFIDDDSEVSSNGIELLVSHFSNHKDCMGASLVLFGGRSEYDNRYALLGHGEKLKRKIYSLVGYKRLRRVSPSGSPCHVDADEGPAEWLSGCDMAFRRNAFENLSFNEELESFGPYAMGEDVEFSHRVFLRYRRPLDIISDGYVIHHMAEGARIPGNANRIALTFFSRYLIMLIASERGPFIGRLSFWWGTARRFFRFLRQDGFSPAFQGLSLFVQRLKKGL